MTSKIGQSGKAITQPDAFSIQRRFNDFDEFAEAVHDWKLEFVQLDRGQFQAEFEQAGAAHFQLGHASFGRLLHQQGDTPAGLRTFVVPGDAAFRILWRGREITGRDIGVFPEGGVLDSVSLPGFDVFVPSLPEQLLDVRARRLGLPPVERIVGGSEVMQCDPDAVDRLRSWLRSVMTELVERPDLLEDSQTSEEIAWAIAGNLLTTLATGGDTPVQPSLRPRLRVSESSLDYIACHPGRVLKVSEVADAVGVSERTLRRAFQERFGVSTKQYLKARQLRAARRELARIDPDRTQVREVALRWGFWHSSQFAQDYRRAFGELPSDTLRRTSRRDA